MNARARSASMGSWISLLLGACAPAPAPAVPVDAAPVDAVPVDAVPEPVAPPVVTAPVEPASPPAACAPVEPYATASADLDGDGAVESITLGHDGVMTIGAATTTITWLHPTSDYWGGLEREQRLVVVPLDRTFQAVVLWQFHEGDEDPDKQFQFFGYWDGAIHPLTEAPLDVAHAGEMAVVGGKITFIEEACVRDATLRADGTPAADGLSRRDVRTLRWAAKRGLTPSLARRETKSRCLMAACPFVDVGSARIGEILRRLSEPKLHGVQSLRLPPASAGIYTVTLAEEKPEDSFIDALHLRVDGVVVRPLECDEGSAACDDDDVAYVLAAGERVDFHFVLPAASDVVLVVDGHYVPHDGSR